MMMRYRRPLRIYTWDMSSTWDRRHCKAECVHLRAGGAYQRATAFSDLKLLAIPWHSKFPRPSFGPVQSPSVQGLLILEESLQSQLIFSFQTYPLYPFIMSKT